MDAVNLWIVMMSSAKASFAPKHYDRCMVAFGVNVCVFELKGISFGYLTSVLRLEMWGSDRVMFSLLGHGQSWNQSTITRGSNPCGYQSEEFKENSKLKNIKMKSKRKCGSVIYSLNPVSLIVLVGFLCNVSSIRKSMLGPMQED